MTIDTLKRLGWFMGFVLLQAIILGHVHLFGVATPLLYIYFFLQLPRNYPKWASLLWAFAMGLLLDTFSNTPGLTATSLTLLAALQPYYMEIYIPRDSAEDFKPSLGSLRATKYFFYAVPLVLLYCLVFYSLELFNFYNWLHWLSCVIGSTLITLVLIYTFEIVKK